MEIIKEEGQEKKVYEKKNSKSEEDPPLERFRIVTKQDQKELPKGAFRKRYSENIQQNYKRTPMLKCDFNKFAKEKFTGERPCRSVISIKLQSNFIEIALRHGCSPVNLLHIFRTPFLKNTSGRVLLQDQQKWDLLEMAGYVNQSFNTFINEVLLHENLVSVSIQRSKEL